MSTESRQLRHPGDRNAASSTIQHERQSACIRVEVLAGRVRHKWEQASRLLYVSWQSLTVSQSRCFEDQLVDRPLTVAHREMEDFIDAT